MVGQGEELRLDETEPLQMRETWLVFSHGQRRLRVGSLAL